MNPSPTPEIVPVIWPVEAEWYHCRGHVTRADFAAALKIYAGLKIRKGVSVSRVWATPNDDGTICLLDYPDSRGPDTLGYPVTVVFAEDCTE